MAQINWGEDLLNFFNHDLANMFKNMFVYPTSCIKRIEQESKVKSIVTTVCAVVVSFVLCTLFSLLQTGGKAFGYCIMTGLVPVFYMVFLAIFAFIVLAIKGKGDILKAVSFTNIHVINYTAVMLIYLILSLFGPSKFLMIIIMLVMVYGLAMGINTARQFISTVDEEGKEAFTWWVSPAVILISVYLAIMIFGKTINIPL